jgi:hypothetical protein
MIHSKRPANEVGTTLLLVRGNARHAERRLPFDEAGR